MIVALHTRYRTTGGEERAVADSAWLAREHLGEGVELIERDSTTVPRATAARGLAAGGLDAAQVTDAIARTGADLVHAHNLLPTFGWRTLAAARKAGAATVLSLHNYRLICAVATCVDPDGNDCVRCHGRNTTPGLRLACRGSRTEGAVYAASLAAWQRRLIANADVVAVPSQAAADRLQALGAAIPTLSVLPHVVRVAAGQDAEAPGGDPDGPALVVARLAREKGIEVALAACAQARVGLVIAGDGPEAGALRTAAAAHGLTVLEGTDGPAPAAGQVRFTGRLDAAALQGLRATARVELNPSRAHETFGLSTLEALLAGLPVVASAVGALAQLPDPVRLVPPGDVAALAEAITAAGDRADHARHTGPAVVRRLAGPQTVAPLLADVYARARARRDARSTSSTTSSSRR